MPSSPSSGNDPLPADLLAVRQELMDAMMQERERAELAGLLRTPQDETSYTLPRPQG